MVKFAQDHGVIIPRQNYSGEVRRLAKQVGRYAHAKQYKRMHRAIKTLGTCVRQLFRTNYLRPDPKLALKDALG